MSHDLLVQMACCAELTQNKETASSWAKMRMLKRCHRTTIKFLRNRTNENGNYKMWRVKRMIKRGHLLNFERKIHLCNPVDFQKSPSSDFIWRGTTSSRGRLVASLVIRLPGLLFCIYFFHLASYKARFPLEDCLDNYSRHVVNIDPSISGSFS